MKKVILDTNIIVSALISPLGNPAKILSLFFNGEIQIYYNDDIMAEYEDVLSRPALKINPEKVGRFIEILRETGAFIKPITSDIHMVDESDRIFYDTAQESDAIIITGNTRHYPTEDFILTPHQFLNNYFPCSH